MLVLKLPIPTDTSYLLILKIFVLKLTMYNIHIICILYMTRYRICFKNHIHISTNSGRMMMSKLFNSTTQCK